MSRKLPPAIALTLAIAIGSAPAPAQTQAPQLTLQRTPLLTATLPASTTWQVEQLQASGNWLPTGILASGSDASATLRLDGFAATATYRLQRVTGTPATLTPTVSFGWHLAAEQSPASQLLLQKSADLTAWTREALLFPQTGGLHLRAIREPLGTRAFFRAETPALPVGDASVYTHTAAANYAGAAGFGPLYDDMPPLVQEGHVAALDPAEYHRGGQNAAAAGECYELAGPFGSATFMITDLTEAPAGTLDVGRGFFDIPRESIAPLSGGQDFGLTVGYRLVPAPVTGPVKVAVLENNGFYVALRAYNHRAGIRKLEVKSSGSTTWQELPRNPFNAFEYLSGGSLVFPVDLRITSRFDEVVSFPSISSMTSGQRISASAQFTVFPPLAPEPARRTVPLYSDRLSKVPGDTWSLGPYGGVSVTEIDPNVAYGGSAASLRVTGHGNFSGVNFQCYPPFPRPEFGVLKLAIRSAAPIAADQVGIWIFGATSPTSTTGILAPPVQLPALSTTWQLFQIPLEASAAPPVLWGFTLTSRGIPLPEIWVDEIAFEGR